MQIGIVFLIFLYVGNNLHLLSQIEGVDLDTYKEIVFLK
jgi:hypothetical protein